MYLCIRKNIFFLHLKMLNLKWSSNTVGSTNTEWEAMATTICSNQYNPKPLNQKLA